MWNSTNRRRFLKQAGSAGAAVFAGNLMPGWAYHFSPGIRPALTARKFQSAALETLLERFAKNVENKAVVSAFEHAMSYTTDHEVQFFSNTKQPFTWLHHTEARGMNLSASAQQTWVYLPLLKEDEALKNLVHGLINAHTRCILSDVYASIFSREGESVKAVEQHWNLANPCYAIKLAYGYWQQTNDTAPFNTEWRSAMQKVLDTFVAQQRMEGKAPHNYHAPTSGAAFDAIPFGGNGYPVKPNGMICTSFRPAGEAALFSYHIPSNWFAVFALDWMNQLAKAVGDEGIARQAFEMGNALAKVLWDGGIVFTERFNNIWVAETNGLGSCHLMDDGYLPSHLSIPYLGDNIFSNTRQSVWENTRKYSISPSNPLFAEGAVLSGNCIAHLGLDMVSMPSIAVRGLTSVDEDEMKRCLQMLVRNASNNYLPTVIHKEGKREVTAASSGVANGMAAEFIWKMQRRKPHLLKGVFNS